MNANMESHRKKVPAKQGVGNLLFSMQGTASLPNKY